MQNVIFGSVLRKLRVQRSLSQEELAFESGLDRTCISLLELGQRSPKLDTLIALSSGLQMSVNDFFLEIANEIDEKRS